MSSGEMEYTNGCRHARGSCVNTREPGRVGSPGRSGVRKRVRLWRYTIHGPDSQDTHLVFVCHIERESDACSTESSPVWTRALAVQGSQRKELDGWCHAAGLGAKASRKCAETAQVRSPRRTVIGAEALLDLGERSEGRELRVLEAVGSRRELCGRAAPTQPCLI